jgi:hypothetical protein
VNFKIITSFPTCYPPSFLRIFLPSLPVPSPHPGMSLTVPDPQGGPDLKLGRWLKKQRQHRQVRCRKLLSTAHITRLVHSITQQTAPYAPHTAKHSTAQHYLHKSHIAAHSTAPSTYAPHYTILYLTLTTVHPCARPFHLSFLLRVEGCGPIEKPDCNA